MDARVCHGGRVRRIEIHKLHAVETGDAGHQRADPDESVRRLRHICHRTLRQPLVHSPRRHPVIRRLQPAAQRQPPQAKPDLLQPFVADEVQRRVHAFKNTSGFQVRQSCNPIGLKSHQGIRLSLMPLSFAGRWFKVVLASTKHQPAQHRGLAKTARMHQHIEPALRRILGAHVECQPAAGPIMPADH